MWVKVCLLLFYIHTKYHPEGIIFKLFIYSILLHHYITLKFQLHQKKIKYFKINNIHAFIVLLLLYHFASQKQKEVLISATS